MILLKNKNRKRGADHYTADPEKKRMALEKRSATRFLHKEEIFKCRSKCKQNYDKNLKDKIEKQEPYTLEYTISKLDNGVYLNYLGKSKNYTMIKEDIKLYKSVIIYTEDFIKYYGGEYLPFSCRVQLLGKFKLNVPREYFCKCGIKLKFDRASQDFTYKGFCKKCMLTPTDVEFYKFKFPDEWKFKFEEHKNKMSESARTLYINSLVCGLCMNRGRNESAILDYMEVKHNNKIDRNYTIIGYKPDGYCHETNTIYEVYEPFHLKKQHKIKDMKRKNEIINVLKCKFVIIYDRTPNKQINFESLQIETYEK